MSVYNNYNRRATAYAQERSFSLIGMQLDLITNKILGNDTLVKLLKRPKREAITEKKDVTQEERMSLIKDKYINLVPMIPKEDEVKSYLIVSFDDFSPVVGTDKAMDYLMTIDIICHRDLWIMDGLCPRPYLIMNELKKEFHMSKLDTWGPTVFMGASNLLMNDNYMGFTMMFSMSALAVEKAEDNDR